MDKGNRKRIGFIFNFDKSWLGGVYYLINIIKSLNFLDEDDKPEVLLFYNPSLSDFVNEIDYPFLKVVPWKYPVVSTAYIKSILFGKNLFIDEIIDQFELDGLYPVNDQPVLSKKALKNKVKLITWYADLQHKFYPEFFSKKKLFFREAKLRLLLKNSSDMVVSSNDVNGHFHKFYKIKKKLKMHVIPFVSIIDDFKFDTINNLRDKYKLPQEYFMVSNQFYKHKNHIVVLKALTKIKEKGIKDIHIVMTGKMEHYNDPEFIVRLREEIALNKLEPYLSMLDVIPRQDQLGLMKHANAVIQPSLFEGWSTVIEDAKSLQVRVIASDIDIHKEQLEDRGYYFDPHNENELADHLMSFPTKNSEFLYEKYENRVRNFAKIFIDIFN